MRLIVLRHAEAEGAALSDAARVLTPRGRAAAAAAGAWLASRSFLPDLAVVSPAARARETWSLAAAELPSAPPVEVDRRIYANDVDGLLAVVAGTDPAVGTLALVGHVPSVSQLVHTLDDESGDPAARYALQEGYPTAALAVFTLPSWTAPAARLDAFTVPR